MANQLLTRQEVTRESLMVLENNLKILPHFSRDYEKEFGKKGGKIGDTLYVRKPQRYIGRDGQAYQPEGLVDTQIPISIDQQSGIDFEFSSNEKYLSLDEFSQRYLTPANKSLANKLDLRAGAVAMRNTPNVVGSPGTTPGLGGTDAFLTYAQAGQKLDEAGFDNTGDRFMIINPAMKTGWADFSKAFFNPQKFVNAAWAGQVSDALGYNWFMDQNLPVQTIGTLGGTPAVNGAGQTGTTIVINGATPNVVNYLNVGDSVSFAGMFEANPQSRQSTGALKQFVIQAPVSTDGGGNATLTIYPGIVPSGQFQNVTNSPASGALMSVYSANAAAQAALSGASSPQGLLFQKQAFMFMSFPGDVPEGVDMGYTENSDQVGVSLRFVRMFDGYRDMWINRFDVYYGFGIGYAEGACRVAA